MIGILYTQTNGMKQTNQQHKSAAISNHKQTQKQTNKKFNLKNKKTKTKFHNEQN
jgi:hypothetical protein